ncbi:GntR family transcriptional regulator [Ottowia thiooxydans]|uniref:GntR family transcriptional regulator n=1 Tax=Ottowia thiooxydans TaxID=219182 RepID=UPI000406882F|nr:GntR family transcriptional regulator [Ottowia thiooxydans]
MSPAPAPHPDSKHDLRLIDRTRSDGAALRTMPEQIAERIYAAIVAGQYQPGERIREDALADSFGVSRGPVREALRILERDFVVRVLANRGAHVTKLTAKEVNDIFEVRRVLAGTMVRRLASMSQATVARFAPAVEKLEQLATAQDAQAEAAYLAASVELSLAIASASGNERLAEIMNSLARQSWRYTKLGLSDPNRRMESARTWRVLLEALLVGDGQVAGNAMEKLVNDSCREAARQLERGAV